MADRTLMFRTQTWVNSKASPETVYEVISDLSAHLEWSGNRASDEGFKLLSLEAPQGPVSVGTRFTSTGSAGKTHSTIGRSSRTRQGRTDSSSRPTLVS